MVVLVDGVDVVGGGVVVLGVVGGGGGGGNGGVVDSFVVGSISVTVVEVVETNDLVVEVFPVSNLPLDMAFSWLNISSFNDCFRFKLSVSTRSIIFTHSVILTL